MTSAVASSTLPHRPIRWLLSSWGSRGDLHPFLGLGQRLVERGHRVTLVGHPDWREETELAGLRFLATDEPPRDSILRDHPKLMSQRGSGMESFQTLIRQVLQPSLEPTARALLQAAPEHDVIVAHHFSYAAPLVAELTGLPLATVTLAPGVIPSAYGLPAPHYGRARRGPLARSMHRFIWKIGRAKLGQLVDPMVNELRAQHGAGPVRDATFSFPTAQVNLQLYSRHFAAPAPDWTVEKKQGGFCHYHPPKMKLSAKIEEFLDAGEPPILATLGTMAMENPGAFYVEISRALKKMGRRGILLLGLDENRPADLPSSILAVPYAAFGALMPRVAAVVHQGGIGTVSHALCAGVPSVVCPFAFDQPNNARRLEALSVAEVLRPEQRRAPEFIRALSRLEAGPARKVARRLGEILRDEDGPQLSCAILEKTFGA